MINWLDIPTILYLSLNTVGFLYCLLYGFLYSSGPWDVLIFPVVTRLLDENEYPAYTKVLAVILLLLLFPIGLFVYYFTLLMLVIVVILAIKTDSLIKTIKRRRRK